jgi:hypothetical protein
MSEELNNFDSFFIQETDDDGFKKWLKTQGLDDPHKMLELAIYLIQQKYEGAKSIEYFDQHSHEGFVVYRFKVVNYSGKEYIQGSWRLIRGY